MKDRRRKEVQTCAENDQEEAEQAKADGFVGPRPHGDGRLSTLDDARLLSMCGPRRAVAFRRSGLALDRFPGRCAPRCATWPGRNKTYLCNQRVVELRFYARCGVFRRALRSRATILLNADTRFPAGGRGSDSFVALSQRTARNHLRNDGRLYQAITDAYC